MPTVLFHRFGFGLFFDLIDLTLLWANHLEVAANRLAMASPMPDAPPVMTAVLEDKLKAVAFIYRCSPDWESVQ